MNTSHVSRSAKAWVLVAFLALLRTNPSALAETEQDPVVNDVISMLGSQVDEGVILQWLESTDRRPMDVGSQGIIELTQAGASEGLITALLERVESASSVEPASVTEPEPADPETPISELQETVIQLRAKRAWVEEDEPDRPREAPWDVYLYLDGDLVSWTRPTLQGDPVEARTAVSVGKHELRVVLQRYEEQRGGWLQESLSVPTPIAFEARPGDPVEIDVEMRRIWGLWRQRKDGGPLSYVIRQGTQILTENGGTGGDPERWQPICEDVEANFPNADTVPSRFRNVMSRCIQWADLWTVQGTDSNRSAMLERFAEYDFEPPVR